MENLQLRAEVGDDLTQITGLRMRAYTTEGENEPLEAQLKVRIKPTTVARLKLLSQSNAYGYPSIDEMVDEALHDYLVLMGR
jgi:hypothetical protein